MITSAATVVSISMRVKEDFRFSIFKLLVIEIEDVIRAVELWIFVNLGEKAIGAGGGEDEFGLEMKRLVGFDDVAAVIVTEIFGQRLGGKNKVLVNLRLPAAKLRRLAVEVIE